MSQFDPSVFLDATIDTPLAKRKTLPEGEYLAQIGEVKSRAWQSRDGTKSGIAYDVPLELQIPFEHQEELGYNHLNLTDSIMLDITPQGTIDIGPGKNGKLRTYREALDMNREGTKFSARLMQGQMIKVRVKHEPYEDSAGETQLAERIKGVAKA